MTILLITIYCIVWAAYAKFLYIRYTRHKMVGAYFDAGVLGLIWPVTMVGHIGFMLGGFIEKKAPR